MGMIPPSVDLAVAKLQSMLDEQLQQKGLVKHVVLYLIPRSGAGVTFGGRLVAAKAVGAATGISCATLVLAPLVGCLALYGAYAASAQVSYSLRKLYSHQPLTEEGRCLSIENLLINAVFGVIAFKILGGNCWNLMPTNVVNLGALARGSYQRSGARASPRLVPKVWL